jgi:AhpD family alkylhydroperoxidase
MYKEQENFPVQAENVQLHTIQPRMKNPAAVIPEANSAIQDLIKATYKGGVSPRTLELVHLRASQINGCSFCVGSSARSVTQKGESVERLLTVAAWREAPYFTDAERAALALTEAVTRLADRSDPVPDAVWGEATKYYDEREMAALLLWIATTNLFNHLNVPTRQPAGVQSW